MTFSLVAMASLHFVQYKRSNGLKTAKNSSLSFLSWATTGGSSTQIAWCITLRVGMVSAGCCSSIGCPVQCQKMISSGGEIIRKPGI